MAGHWQAFDIVKVRDVLTSFVLENLGGFANLVARLTGGRQGDLIQKLKSEYCKWLGSDNSRRVKKVFQKGYSFEKMIELNIDLWRKMEDNHHIIKTSNITSRHFCFVAMVLPEISNMIRRLLISEDSFLYTRTYQNVGNIVRTFGELDTSGNRDIQEPGAIFCVARRINYIIKMYRKKDWFLLSEEEQKKQEIHSSPVRIVIDSIKNLFEAIYLRDRYSAFYLFAISVSENKRQEFLQAKDFDLEKPELRIIDYCERPSEARKAYQEHCKLRGRTPKTSAGDALYSFFEDITCGSYPYGVWKDAYDNATYTFNMQDVEACIQNADIFINNNKNKEELTKNIVKYVCLMMHPGLVQPTDDERCMQIAQTAKVNSGCVSRQVGAVVCDDRSNILSIGWNQPSANRCNEVVPCLYRNFEDCYNKNDQMAYSELEREDEEFREYLSSCFSVDGKDVYKDVIKEYRKRLQGLPMTYCFKDLYCDFIGSRNQVHTRSQHAEEIALESSNQRLTEGGTLYTTSCSCELCAKKALHYGIKRMVYVEPYFGITEKHVLGFPDADSPDEGQMEVELFTGACHRAYTQLYSPIFPIKDELEMRNVSFKKPKKQKHHDQPDRRKGRKQKQTFNGAG